MPPPSQAAASQLEWVKPKIVRVIRNACRGEDQRRLDSSNNEQVALTVQAKASTEARWHTNAGTKKDLDSQTFSLNGVKQYPNLPEKFIGVLVPSVLTLLALTPIDVGNRSGTVSLAKWILNIIWMLKSMLLIWLQDS